MCKGVLVHVCVWTMEFLGAPSAHMHCVVGCACVYRMRVFSLRVHECVFVCVVRMQVRVSVCVVRVFCVCVRV